MFYIGIGLGIFAFLGLLVLLVEWEIKSGKAKKQHRQQQWQTMISQGSNLATQAKIEAEQAEQQAIQDEYQRLQVNLAAVDAEIQMLQVSQNLISQQGLKTPEEVELLMQKRQLEKRSLELESQGVTQKSLYDDINRKIEQIEMQLQIVERGDIGKTTIEQQGEIRNCLRQIAQEQAIALVELKKDLEKKFTSAEVQDILSHADYVLKEVLAMTAAALVQNSQQLSSSSLGTQIMQSSGANNPNQSLGKIAFDSSGKGYCLKCNAEVYQKDKCCHNCGARIKK